MMKTNILIVTGEPSGDIRAAEMLKELKKLTGETVSFWGIGGDNMADQGVELTEHIKNLSLVGVVEVVKKIFSIRRQFNKVEALARERKPALAILIDYPGFNLKLAKFLHDMGVPVIYYVIPQVWAWGKDRIKLLKKYVDKALVLFGFEEILLKQHGIDCTFVGHPLLDRAPLPKNKEPHKDSLTIALLPGSRNNEILGMLPRMLETAEKLLAYKKNTNFILAESSNINKTLYETFLEKHRSLPISRLTDNTFACLDECDFAIVTSGTATLETAIMEKPMIIVYRASMLTYILYKLFIRIPFLGLVNIISGKEIAPELLQRNAVPEKMFRKTVEITSDLSRMHHIRAELGKIRPALGNAGASKRAAETIYAFMTKRGIR